MTSTWNARYRLAGTPRTSLAELPDGQLARVVGRTAQLDEVLEAPLTGRRCLYYQLTVAQPVLFLSETLAHEERSVLFTLDDGTARAIIDPSQCILDGRDTSASYMPTDRESALLTRLGIEPKLVTQRYKGARHVRLDRRFIYRESIIGVGETIAILGSGVREPDPDAPPEAAYRGTQPTRLRMSGGRNQPMIISDDPSTTR